MTIDTSKELPIDQAGNRVQGAIRQDATGAIVNDGYYTPLQVDSLGRLKISASGVSSSGSGAPSSTTPTFVGQLYVDTSIPKAYVSTGLTSSDRHEIAIL